MLLPGERVVAGISGGADSVCLLFVLLEWRMKYGLEPVVVHINHGIRPEAAEDACFVESICEKYELPFYLFQADIPRLACETGCSEEEAGRNFRYETFAQVAREQNASKIAVAHNKNDLCETMLFHLFRGTGVKGLAGIAPVRGEIIRPLLCVERYEIEQYLADRKQDFCRDCTNEQDDYTRNRIRHHILAYAEQEIVSSCVQNMGRTAAILAETEDYLEQMTKEALEACLATKEGDKRCEAGVVKLNCEQVVSLHPAIAKRVILEAIQRVLPGVRDLTRVHVEEVYGLFVRTGNRKLSLPYGMQVYREYGMVTFLQQSHMQNKNVFMDEYEVDFQVFDREELPVNQENLLLFPQNQYTKWFDYDKIEKSPVFRTRETGDYFTIRNQLGELCHKKLKDYLVTAKIPASVRDHIPLLAIDSHILWIVGHRISEYYKVCENTKHVLQVQLTVKENDHAEEEDGGIH